MITDAHCHFFSSGFFRTLGKGIVADSSDAAVDLPARLGWDAPASNMDLADRWIATMDQAGVARVMLIASLPGDESSVAEAVAHRPDRFAGAFMVNPAAPDAPDRTAAAFSAGNLSMACLFPAMHHVPVDDQRSIAIFELARSHRRAVFVHCGVLSVGVRAKLGLVSPFDLRLGDPLAVAAVAVRFPEVPIVIPHFGAGLFREALMAARAAPNIVIDTSSSNGWIAYHPKLTLQDVFARALEGVGPNRLLFGTDSSFFPRGWQRGVYDTQRGVLAELNLDEDSQRAIFSGNFERLFGTATR